MGAGWCAILSSSANLPAAISGTGSEIISLPCRGFPEPSGLDHEEVMQFIEHYGLMGKGLGYIDMHLLAAARLTGVALWTLDKRLNEVALKLGVARIFS